MMVTRVSFSPAPPRRPPPSVMHGGAMHDGAGVSRAHDAGPGLPVSEERGSMLSVVHCWLSPGPSGGGGGIAMWRLHESLLAAGVRSRVLCQLDAPDRAEVDLVPRRPRLDNMVRRLTNRLGLNDIHRVSSRLIARHPFFREADVVHFHGLHTGFLSYLALPALTRRKPAVFTMHDFWALTGHCTVTYGCERWRTGCGRCPHLDTHPAVRRDATRIEWKLKEWAYSRSRLNVIALSRRHAEAARQGLLSRFPVHRIPNGIDTGLFRPQDTAHCRSALGIPHDRHVIMFAALHLDQFGKGGDLLVAALRQLPEEVRDKTVLLLVGGNGTDISAAAGIPSINLGIIAEPERMATAYGAADLFVSPTRGEAFSLVLAEAMACGTPLAAFDVGGVPDLVRPGVTGHLAPPEDAADLGRGIAELLRDEPRRRELGRNCSAIALAEYSASSVTARHIQLYEAVAAGAAATSPARRGGAAAWTSIYLAAASPNWPLASLAAEAL
jgi:glycosyltransferase involved in cell wall biosynthesis